MSEQTPDQQEGSPQLIHVNLEDDEVKGDDNHEEKCDKTNSARLPILSDLAKHVLGMPVSSVASEAAFSTGGRTIDAYRSSLSPKTAEALVCSQDWLSNSGNMIDLRGEPEEYLQYEKMENAELKVVGNLMEKLDIDD